MNGVVDEVVRTTDEKIDDHEVRIRTLEINTSVIDEKVTHIANTQEQQDKKFDKLENIMLTNFNQLLNNQTQKEIAKSNNVTKIIVQSIILLGVLAGVFFAGTKV